MTEEPTPMTMSSAEAAKRLGVSADWLSRQARAGLIPHVMFSKRRRFTEEHLQAILRHHEYVSVEMWERAQPGSDPWIRDGRQRAWQRRRRRMQNGEL